MNWDRVSVYLGVCMLTYFVASTVYPQVIPPVAGWLFFASGVNLLGASLAQHDRR